jgi:hypothetical protein
MALVVVARWPARPQAKRRVSRRVLVRRASKKKHLRKALVVARRPARP